MTTDERANCTRCKHSLDDHLGASRGGELPCATCDCWGYEAPITGKGVAGIIWTFLDLYAKAARERNDYRDGAAAEAQGGDEARAALGRATEALERIAYAGQDVPAAGLRVIARDALAEMAAE